MKNLIVIFLIFCNQAFGTTYYVSNTGSDAANGTSTGTPWQTITKVNAGTYIAGDQILFNGGQTFTGSLLFSTNSSGTSGNPITIDSYGTGNATISSSAAHGIKILNTAGIIIQNLTVQGNTTTNTFGIYASITTPANVTLNYLKFHNLTVLNYDNGILLGGDATDNSHSGFSNVEVSNCTVHDCINNGISSYANSYGTGYGLLTLLIQYNTIYNIVGVAATSSSSGNGIVLGETNGATVQYNVVHDCGVNNTSGNGPVGVYTYDSANITIQFNEVYNQKTNSNADGGGFDIDGGVSNSAMQYNYSHNNYGPGYLFFSYNDGLVTTWNNNVCRYNISQNDASHAPTAYAGITISASSTMTNAYCYNNSVYQNLSTGSDMGWLGTSIGTATGYVCNNIFLSEKGANLINTFSTNPSTFTITNNDYYNTGAFSIKWNGTTYSTFSAWQTATSEEKISGVNVAKTSNPLLISPAALINLGGYVPASLTSFNLFAGSTMGGTGVNLSTQYSINPGTQDYYGNAIPNSSGNYDIGASAYTLQKVVNFAIGLH